MTSYDLLSGIACMERAMHFVAYVVQHLIASVVGMALVARAPMYCTPRFLADRVHLTANKKHSTSQYMLEYTSVKHTNPINARSYWSTS